MRTCFKLLAVFVVFLCLYAQESDASKEWFKDRFNDAKRAINKRFNRETLTKFLEGGPKLFAKKAISKAKELFFKNSLGTRVPNDEEMKAIAAKFPQKSNKMANHAEVKLPTNFDARVQWPNCPSIREISNQCGCGSCWAVCSTNAFSDRLCIASNGTRTARISTMDLASCCGKCKGGNVDEDGCQGGILPYAYQYFQTDGLVSGGPYGNKEGCLPYKWSPTSETGFGAKLVTPRCSSQKKCVNNLDYNKDKYYGGDVNVIQPGDIDTMMREIYTKGSITVAFMVPQDFSQYNGGIYYRTPKSGGDMGGHGVRLIGWGEENDIPYWLIANSWGPCWGEGGTAKIIRGKNELGIESRAVAGDIDLTRSASG